MYTTLNLSEQKNEVFNGPDRLRIVTARAQDLHNVLDLFEALHTYNASLDPHFALSDNWETILCEEFNQTHNCPDKLWLLVKDGEAAVALLIASVHVDSPLFAIANGLK